MPFIKQINSLLAGITILILIGLVQHSPLVYGEPIQGTDNVCNITVPYKKDIKLEIPVNYELKVQTMCGIMPCTKTRVETRYDESIKTIIQHVEKRTCCQGYAETPDRKCAPICLNSCNNGKCIKPNLCRCHPEPTKESPGFVGPTCSRFVCLESNKWGSKCNRECNCPINSYCNGNTGVCLCYPGWRGENCTVECDSSHDHPDCGGFADLPPIVEPEANLVIESSARSGKLLLPDALVIEKNSETESRSSDRTNFWVCTTMFSMVCWVSLLAYLIVKRRNRLPREDPYYEACSSPGSSPDNYYSSSNSSYSHATAGRAPGDYFGKNVSMTAAIRNVLNGVDLEKNSQIDSGRLRPIIAPRIETHLIDSQRSSEKNLYSELSCNNSDCHLYAVPTNRISDLNLNLSNSSTDAHIYQVPKSPASRSAIGSPIVNFLNNQKDHDASIESPLDTQHDTQSAENSNIYEELKPRSPKGH